MIRVRKCQDLSVIERKFWGKKRIKLYTYISVLRIGGGELMRCRKWATADFKSKEFSFRESVRSADEIGAYRCVYAGKSE